MVGNTPLPTIAPGIDIPVASCPTLSVSVCTPTQYIHSETTGLVSIQHTNVNFNTSASGETSLAKSSVSTVVTKPSKQHIAEISEVHQNFGNVNGLTQRGLNEFEASNLSGLPTFGAPVDGVFGQIVQGSIEASNTDVSNEMVMMMRAQQAFGASSRLVQAEADIVSTFTKG